MALRYVIDGILIDPDGNEVHAFDKVVRLEPKTMGLLTLLIANADKTLSKEEILAKLWPDIVVTEDSIIRCISQLRKVFNDDSQTPRIIETIPKKGYRLKASVKTILAEEKQPSSSQSPPIKNSENKKRSISPWVAGGIAAFVALGAAWGNGDWTYGQRISIVVASFGIVYCLFFYLRQRD